MLFDPTLDFTAQTAQAQQARAYAEALRKQALGGSAQPTGQMVSNRFVPPHWTQYLGGLMDKVNAGWQGSIADTAEKQLADAQAKAAQQWYAGLPEPIAARPATEGMSATPFGSRDAPQQDAVPGTPAVSYQPVPVAARLKHTLAGMQNPLTAKAAMLWNTGMAEETKREDEQAARYETLLATLAQRREDALRRSEDVRLGIDARREAAAQAEATRLQIAQMMADARINAANISAATRQGTSAAKTERAEERRQDKLDRQLEHLSEKTKTLAPFIQTGQKVQDLLDKYGDKPIPGLGYVGSLPGFMLSKEGNVNRATIKAFANAMLRNQAGLSQTLSETENANLEILANGKFTEKEFRAVWPNLRDKVGASVLNVSSGFMPEAVEIFRKRGGLIDPIKSKVPAGLTPEEQAELERLRQRFPGVNK